MIKIYEIIYKMNCYTLHTYLLVTVLLFMIIIHDYYYLLLVHKTEVKTKKYWHTNNIKIISEIKNVIHV